MLFLHGWFRGLFQLCKLSYCHLKYKSSRHLAYSAAYLLTSDLLYSQLTIHIKLMGPMASFNFRGSLKLFVTLFLFSFIASSVLAASSQKSAAPSPAAKAELICHTDNPAECYPKVFSPTEEFQVVRDDQDLPPGLHVRLDIQTGYKEARLNVPDNDNPALAGLPVDQAVMVINPEPSDDEPKLPPGAPAYEPVGVVKEPPVKNPGFAAALGHLKEHAETALPDEGRLLDAALAELEELSHDMYYGHKIIEDADALKALFCLVTQRDATQIQTRAYSDRRDFLASTVLASALQNNPPALRSIESEWEPLMQKQCAFHKQPLKDIIYAGLEPKARPMSNDHGKDTSTDSVDYTNEASWTRPHLSLIGQLLKSDVIRPEFVSSGGMKNLLQILLTKGSAWDPARARVGRVVSDAFLDESVGAKVGTWPSEPLVVDSGVCEAEPTRLQDGCWEHHLEKMIQADPEGSENLAFGELLALLKQRRPQGTAPDAGRVRDEL